MAHAMTPREALEELSKRLRTDGDCGACDVAPLPDQPELTAHADGCPVRVLLDALRTDGTCELASSALFKIDGIHDRLRELEAGLATALGAGLLQKADESRVQSIEEREVALEARVETLERIYGNLNEGLRLRCDRLDSRVVGLEALERIGPEPEVEESLGFQTWAARRIDVSRRAVANLEALHPSHVMSPLYEKLVELAKDADRPTTRLEELQQAAEDLTYIWSRLEGPDEFGRKGPISYLANALRTWLSDELELDK